MSNLVNSNLGRTPKPSSLIQDRSCHSGRLQIAPSNLTDVFIGLQISIYEIHFYIFNKWTNHLLKLGWGWLRLNDLLGCGSRWYGSSQTWSDTSVRCLYESVSEAIRHALGRSHDFVQIHVRVRVWKSEKSNVYVRVCLEHGLGHELMSQLLSMLVHLWFVSTFYNAFVW